MVLWSAVSALLRSSLRNRAMADLGCRPALEALPPARDIGQCAGSAHLPPARTGPEVAAMRGIADALRADPRL
jgi:hypothetical protein